MYGVELYAAVRLAVVDEGLSHHEAGRRFGIDRRTVKKMLSYSAPPGYPRETTEAFLDGHVSAFAFLGGVPRSILYDNTTLAVARILGDGTRRRTQAFTHLQSHYLFRDRFGRPGKGNDKGKVEALVKTARRRFMVPIPKVHDLSVLNERLTARCLERLDALEAGDRRRRRCSPISRPCAICRRFPSRPASMCRARSPRRPWCATGWWTTRHRRCTPTRRSW